MGLGSSQQNQEQENLFKLFSRDIVVCIIIQLEKIDTMKAYRVVYTEDGYIRIFFLKYRKMLEESFKMCKAHLMAQSIPKHHHIILKTEQDSLNFTFYVFIRGNFERLQAYKHVSYHEYHKTRGCLLLIVHGVGLCIIFENFEFKGAKHTMMKITKLKSSGVGIIAELDNNDTRVYCKNVLENL